MIVINYNGFFRFLILTFNIKVYLFLSLPFQFFFSVHPLTLSPFSLYTHPPIQLTPSLPAYRKRHSPPYGWTWGNISIGRL